jgi:hypothetical protein
VSAAARADWENDSPHHACWQWITAWREDHPDDPRPSWRFAEHLGRCALAFHAEGMSRVELARLFSASGHDGTCACGEPAQAAAAVAA